MQMNSTNSVHLLKDFRVAVVGGGMCGLLTAIGLSRAGIEVNIYEAATSFREIGAGVGIGPNAVRVLGYLDVLDAILEHIKPEVPEPRPFRFLTGEGKNEIIYDYPHRPEDAAVAIHRAVILDALSPLLDPSKTHFNKRCIRLVESEGAESQTLALSFADGSTATADIVIGADGVRSVIRSYVVGDDEHVEKDEKLGVTRAAFTNTLAYRGLINVSALKEAGVGIDFAARPHCFTGKGKHIIVFPIKNDTVINVVAFTCDRTIEWGERPLPPGQSTVTQRTTQELLDTYADFSEDVRLLLGCMPDPSVWAIHGVAPLLDTYSKGRVTLVGDAAHGMLPHLGSGAGQGIEDSYALIRLLAHPKTSSRNINQLLQAYSSVRRDHAHSVHRGSTRAGDIYEGFGPSGPGIEGMRADLTEFWDWVWHYDVTAAVDATILQLERDGVLQ